MTSNANLYCISLHARRLSDRIEHTQIGTRWKLNGPLEALRRHSISIGAKRWPKNLRNTLGPLLPFIVGGMLRCGCTEPVIRSCSNILEGLSMKAKAA